MSANPSRNLSPEPDYVRYEQLKREWTQKHPGATPEEYEVAIRRIANECGV